MYINYWNPLREAQGRKPSRDQAFRPAARSQRGYPPIDLVDAGDHFVLRAILPGVAAEDLHISVAGDQVSLEGTKKVKHEQAAKPIRRERMYGNFQRTVRLPEAVDTDNVEASRSDGVLTLRLPKARMTGPVTIQL